MARRLQFSRFILLTFAALALGPAPAEAQFLPEPPPRINAGVGFSMQTPPDVNMRPLCEQMSLFCTGSGRTFPDFGVAVSVAGRVAGPIAIVGEVNIWGNAWRVDGTAAGRRTNQVFAGLAGLRFQSRTFTSRRDLSSASFFGQLLVGAQAADEVPGRRVWQPGGGMDVHIRDTNLAFRIEMDYDYSPGPGRNLTTGRAFMGIVIGSGPS